MPSSGTVKPPTARTVDAPEPEPRPRAVLVGADRETRHEATEALEEQGFAVRCASDPQTAYRLLLDGRADLLAVAAELPGDADGFALCRRAVAEELAPAVYVYGPDRNELAQRCFDAGGDDYLPTPFRWSVCARRLAHLSRGPAAAARVDKLTDLPNRRTITEILERTAAAGNRRGTRTAVLYLDLDRFKRVNETLGHRSGDQLLRLVAARIRRSLRKGDHLGREAGGRDSPVARLGGDKFIIILSDLEHPEDAARLARRVLENLDRPFSVGRHETFISASIGIALHPPDGDDAEVLLQQAESAMYYAKQQGRGRFQFYSHWMNASSERKLDLEHKLRAAVERDEFSLCYQPIVDCYTQRVVGAEALLRWNQPEEGLVPPDEFIPVAEEVGLMNRIGGWLLHAACRQFQEWHLQGMPAIRLSVNISSCQLRDDQFVETVRRTLDETGFDPQQLDFELTEREVMVNDPASMERLKALNALGIRIAVDDFGTGHSALVYLKKVPLDVLKIDRSFVQGIRSESSDSAIISAVIAMAHRLNLRVVAEGVETPEQLGFLRNQQCDEIQGFLFSVPLESERFAELALDADPRLEPGDNGPSARLVEALHPLRGGSPDETQEGSAA